jgi:hypothetical protein
MLIIKGKRNEYYKYVVRDKKDLENFSGFYLHHIHTSGLDMGPYIVPVHR